jgi:hypothetical protein
MISHSSYKNKNSIVLQSTKIRAELIPECGGKMASLINKETGYEYLIQRKNEIYRDQPFDGTFVDGECSGYDDMFPTIDICEYENEPWKGVKMADHGEVWSLPWEVAESDSSSLKMSVNGVRFPYYLEKEISFINEKKLRSNYTLTNSAPFSFEFLWAGHLMINIEEGTRVQVPEDCRKAITVLTNGEGAFGDVNNWPLFKDNNGKPYRADICRPKEIKGFEKYYFSNRLKDGWCELKYPGNINRLKISFPVDNVPFLGILMNEGGWDDLYNIIIEPCTICYDKPDVAKKYGQVSKVEAFGRYAWYVEIEI